MSIPRKIFFGVLAAGVALGFIIGLIKMVAPGAASVTLNGAEVTGVTAVIVATVSGAIGAAIIGLIGAGVAALVTRKKQN